MEGDIAYLLIQYTFVRLKKIGTVFGSRDSVSQAICSSAHSCTLPQTMRCSSQGKQTEGKNKS